MKRYLTFLVQGQQIRMRAPKLLKLGARLAPETRNLIYIHPCYRSQIYTERTHTLPVSEIKGAPCTRRAHFHSRSPDFWRCAPSVCTFVEPFIITIYWEGAWCNFRVHSFMGSAPCECTNQKLNFGHCLLGQLRMSSITNQGRPFWSQGTGLMT